MEWTTNMKTIKFQKIAPAQTSIGEYGHVSPQIVVEESR